MMLLADSKPIYYEHEKKDIREMMQKLNLGIGVATASGGTQEDVQGHAETINQS